MWYYSLPQSGQAIYSLPPLHSLNGSAVILAAAELLAYNKKERSCEIIENLDPMCRQHTLDMTLWLAVSNVISANQIGTQFVSTNQI